MLGYIIIVLMGRVTLLLLSDYQDHEIELDLYIIILCLDFNYFFPGKLRILSYISGWKECLYQLYATGQESYYVLIVL